MSDIRKFMNICEGRIVDLRDPDNAPGAYDLEATARANARDSNQVKVQNINKVMSDLGLGLTVKIDKVTGIFGDFIVSDQDTCPITISGKQYTITLATSARDSDLKFYINGLLLNNDSIPKVTSLIKSKMTSNAQNTFRISLDPGFSTNLYYGGLHELNNEAGIKDLDVMIRTFMELKFK